MTPLRAPAGRPWSIVTPAETAAMKPHVRYFFLGDVRPEDAIRYGWNVVPGEIDLSHYRWHTLAGEKVQLDPTHQRLARYAELADGVLS